MAKCRRITSIIGIMAIVIVFAFPLKQNTTNVYGDISISDGDFLKTDGKLIKNNYGNGSKITLRGVNAGGWLFQEIWMCPTVSSDNVKCQTTLEKVLTDRFGATRTQTLIDTYMDNYWTETDFNNCSELGINVIRLPFIYQNLQNEDGTMKEGGFDRIDWFVEECSKRGIYVVLDMHGVPGSQSNSQTTGDSTKAGEFFFGDNALENQKKYYDLWVEIAKHYNGNPTIAGYDLLNEPYNDMDQYTGKDCWDIYNKAYEKIREVDQNHIIIMESKWNAWDLPNPKDYKWENVVYEYHQYNYDDTSPEKQAAGIQYKLDGINAMNYNCPSYIGETSFFSEQATWETCLKLLQDADISYTLWSYKCWGKNYSWGLYTQDIQKADCEQDSYNTIKKKWANSGTSSKNEYYYDIAYKYFNTPVYQSYRADGSGRYEAEDAEFISEGGSIGNSEGFSQEKYVENINQDIEGDMNNAKYLQFSIKSNTSGTYKLKIGYSSWISAKEGLSVNDKWTYINTETTGDWNIIAEKEVNVQLNKGTNTIKLTGSIEADSWIIIDYIDVELDTRIEETTQPLTTEESSTTVQELTTSYTPETTMQDQSLNIEGYQISASLYGISGKMGTRIIYSREDLENLKIAQSGIILGLNYKENQIQESEMTLESKSDYVKNIQSTSKGLSDINYSNKQAAQCYIITLEVGDYIKEGYTTEYSVRAYSVLENGTTIYGPVEKFSIYQVASYVYENRKMSTEAGHNYVLNNILRKVDPNYPKTNYITG